MTHDERVRFCTSCGSVIGWYALHCEHCGEAQARMPAGAPAELPAEGGVGVRERDSLSSRTTAATAAAAADVSRQIFKGHLHLVHRYRERVEVLLSEAARIERKLARAVARGGDRGRLTEEARSFADRIEDLLDSWESVQTDYNRDAQALDDDFLERADELEVDVNLPPELESAVAAEIEAFERSLETLAGDLDRVGRRAREVALAGRRLRLLAPGRLAPAAAALWFAVAGLLPALATAALARFRVGLGLTESLLLGAPPAVLAAIFLGARALRRSP